MHFAIDLRFLSSEPYGLSVHIRELMREYARYMFEDTYSKVSIILNNDVDSTEFYNLIPELQPISHKIELLNVSFKNYSFGGEQIGLARFLYTLNADLVFFFTFNYPILYMRPFVYQILDTSHLKSNSPLNPKLLAIRLIMSVGVRVAQHIFFLGKHTRNEVEEITRMKFDESNSTIVHNGLSRLFIDQPSANSSKSELIKLPFSPSHHQLQAQLCERLAIQKPYFLFVSVWRPYKNILRLAQAFDRFNVDNKYQLVLAGKVDPKYSSIKDEVTELEQFKLGNIIITGMIQNDEDIVLLQDGALAFVGPSLSEGFGLWIVESASRGTPILCSNIEVFQNLLDSHSACFFDGEDVNDIAKTLTMFVNMDKNNINQLVVNAHTISTQYRWTITAHTIHTMISRYEHKK